MLVSSKEMILQAQKNGYAIGAFNVSNLETIKAVIAAAEKKRAPIIMAITESSLAYAGFPYLVALAKEAIKLANLPIALHLDHGKTLEMIKKCLEAGFSSVMIDGSGFEFAENVQLSKEVVDLAQRKNVPVEGEIGSLGKDKNKFTDPLQAKDFAEQTKVDFLAVAIGTEHGVAPGQQIDFDLLTEITSQVKIPLVLHGSSGNKDEDIAKAVKKGICKVNLHTDIKLAFIEGFKKGLEENPQTDDHRVLLNYSLLEMQKVIEKKIDLFGSAGRI